MEPNQTNSRATQASASGTHFGSQFKDARTQRQISLEDAAKELCILPRHLKAIESEDFAALPQYAFVRGFVSNYAKFLGLNVASVLDAFETAYPEHLKSANATTTKSPLQPMGTLQRQSKRPRRINPLMLLWLALLLLVIGLFVRTLFGSQTATTESDPSQTFIENTDQIAGASVPASTQTPATTNNMAQESAATAQTAELEFWVQNNTQVNVTDATGQVLLAGMQGRGGYDVAGVPPFSIEIENVRRVSMNLNQEPVRLQTYADANNQASFTLAP